MNQNNDSFKIFLEVISIFKDILIGGFGGVVAYMYDYNKAKRNLTDMKWSNSALFINSCLGAFVAYTVGAFIPMDVPGRDGIIGFAGVTSYAILGIIESRFAEMIISKLTGGGPKL